MADNRLAIWKTDEALKAEMQRLVKQGPREVRLLTFCKKTLLNIHGAFARLTDVYVILKYILQR
jgi:hypothetical protein